MCEVERPRREAAIGTSERRRGLRIRQARPVRIFGGARGGQYFGGRTEDISATGLRIELPAAAPLQVGRVISVHVGLSPAGASLANRKHVMPARVVWVEHDLPHGHAIAGIEFIASTSAHLDAA